MKHLFFQEAEKFIQENRTTIYAEEITNSVLKYFNTYERAMLYAWDSKKEFKEESAQSEIGETMCINIYENYQIIERLFFDESLYQNVPYRDRY